MAGASMEDCPLYPTGVQTAFSRADPAETFTQTSLWVRVLRDVGARKQDFADLYSKPLCGADVNVCGDKWGSELHPQFS